MGLRFGEFWSCCCLPLLPQLAWKTHATRAPLFLAQPCTQSNGDPSRSWGWWSWWAIVCLSLLAFWANKASKSSHGDVARVPAIEEGGRTARVIGMPAIGICGFRRHHACHRHRFLLLSSTSLPSSPPSFIPWAGPPDSKGLIIWCYPRSPYYYLSVQICLYGVAWVLLPDWANCSQPRRDWSPELFVLKLSTIH